MFEVQFITEGSVAAGYRLFNDEFLAKPIGRHAVIGAYCCLKNKVSEFLFRPLENVQGLAIRKKFFLDLITEHVGKRLKENFELHYLHDIRRPCYKHREQTAWKSQNRIDYVSLHAFGVDVETNDEERDVYAHQESNLNEDAVQLDPSGILKNKLMSLDKSL